MKKMLAIFFILGNLTAFAREHRGHVRVKVVKKISELGYINNDDQQFVRPRRIKILDSRTSKKLKIMQREISRKLEEMSVDSKYKVRVVFTSVKGIKTKITIFKNKNIYYHVERVHFLSIDSIIEEVINHI